MYNQNTKVINVIKREAQQELCDIGGITRNHKTEAGVQGSACISNNRSCCCCMCMRKIMLSFQHSGSSGCVGRPISEIEFLMAADGNKPRPSLRDAHTDLADTLDISMDIDDDQLPTPRQLSEVEIQVLRSESPEQDNSCARRDSSCSMPSTLDDSGCYLVPPSLNEVFTSTISLPPSLEDVHRAHAYSARRLSDSSRRRDIGDGGGGSSSRRRNSDTSSRRRRRSFEKQQRRRFSATKRSTETLCAIAALTEQFKYKGHIGEQSSTECCGGGVDHGGGEGADQGFEDELENYEASRKDTLVSPVQSMSI